MTEENGLGNVFEDEMTAEEQAFVEETGADIEQENPEAEAEAKEFRRHKEIAQMLCEIYNVARQGQPITKDITIRKQSLPTPFVFGGQQYTLTSIDAIAQLVLSKGSKEKTVILFSEGGIKIILDDTIQYRPQDTARFSFETSDEVDEWFQFARNNRISQKEFVDFLRKREMFEVSNSDELLTKIQNLKVATEIVGDFNYDDNNNVSVMLKIKDKETAIRLPREIDVNIPVLKNSDNRYYLKFDLELFKPKEENEKPYFTLACSNYNKVHRQAVEAEIRILKSLLPDYLILTSKF
ncbi:hypothetical protein [Phosphitispora fastidiosa]|uniref:hypothetical protein n=1 Tax=Phosphitispora fastidiosa TaxID=2837202 RepID=UPI001E326904|nr:hypothetical protein [Phosphitispora fastidiosa]MBU7006337.1 hypothetical protein [Phosphitispora fastidiosa]